MASLLNQHPNKSPGVYKVLRNHVTDKAIKKCLLNCKVEHQPSGQETEPHQGCGLVVQVPLVLECAREVLNDKHLSPPRSKGYSVEGKDTSEPQVRPLGLAQLGGLGVEAHQEDQEAEVEGEEAQDGEAQ